MFLNNEFLTCPATANPSASKEVAIQICKQIWNAAIVVDPCLAARDAENVTQNVTAVTFLIYEWLSCFLITAWNYLYKTM
jgi:hypothetical protein